MAKKFSVEIHGYADDAIMRLKHASLELRILGYAESIVASGALLRDFQGQFLNQCVILLEIEMGSRDYFTDKEYDEIFSRIKGAGIVSTEFLEGVMDKIKMQPKYRASIMKAWLK